MALAVHERLGHYDVLGPLGAGGISEVYRARDTRLGAEGGRALRPLLARLRALRDAPYFARLSDDGRQLVFAGLEEGERRLWLRSLDSATTRPLPGTEGGAPVAWSRDGRRVVFQAPGLVLKELEVVTGAVRTLGALPKGASRTARGAY